ncbi:hypothetical protein [Virgibacillus sp. YIM 98842]|jgi:hypothetical protein|uniref:hypothetical protein n=1 Tax=Virgibacillus sp. YIM 98842 TaxID=2663533 RepID=UPI0013DB093A|nr:hypothetical protein [Virgibacillus sp. YIM 98842]
MKLKKSIKWFFITGLVAYFSFIAVMFLSAFINLNEEKTAMVEQSNYIKEDKPMKENNNDLDIKKTAKKDTEMGVVVPEYSSFEEYVSKRVKHFNGETGMKDKYTTENFKYQLVVTSTNYLKYYNDAGEVPDKLQQLVDDGIKVTDGFENADDPDQYYDELKKIHSQLEKSIK